MRKLLLVAVAFLFCSGGLLAQKIISGTITDENGSPIPNASVTLKETSVGTTTKADGTYLLNVPANAKTLVFSAIDFMPSEIVIGNQTSIDVSLKAENKTLSEVVVVGYSTTTKEAFTGSAKAVNGAQLSSKNVSNVSQALAGEVAGVRVINTSGQPGTAATIRIRGFGSVNGNRDPLYVVDGVPYSGGTSSINPSDIASLTVLKDAAATSIYGSRGANGVIVITTKNGRGAKSYIEVDGRYGSNMSLIPRYSVITSPEEYIALSWEALYNQGVSANSANPTNYANVRLFSTAGIDPRNNIWNAATGADLIDPATKTVKSGVTRKFDPERWEDYAFQSSNRVESNIRLGGGDTKSNYYTSFGYLEDKGYSINSNFKRLSGRVNLNHEVKPWLTTSLNVNYANRVTNNNGQEANSNSVFWFVDNIPPFYPLFLRDAQGNKVADPIFGGYQYDYGSTGRKFGSLTNAIADADYNTLRALRNELSTNATITIKFTKNLSLDNRLGIQYYNDNYVERTNKFYGSAASQNGSIYHRNNELMNQNLLNMLRYANKFGSHNIEVLAAHEATKYKFDQETASGYNLVDNYGLDLANAIVISPTANSYSNTNRLESYFAQANYNYDNTYFLSGSVRTDGSSKFLKGKTWGTFGSVGAGWIVSKMKFMQNIRFIDYLKMKASYGVIGDQAGVGNYAGYTRIDISNLNNQPSFGIPVPGSPPLSWETSKIFQVGADFKLGSFLTGTVEYYVKNTDNLVFNKRIGLSNGYVITTVNDGVLRNQGLEFDLTASVINKRDFFLNVGINGEMLKNKITTMPIDVTTGKPKAIDPQSPYGWAEGHSVYDFYVRNFEDVDPTDGKSRWTVFYDDLNNNKTFDADEQVTDLEAFYSKNPSKKGTLLKSTTKTYSQATVYFVGKSAIPKLRGGINLNTGYKGIELNVQFLYSLGGYAYDGAYAGLMDNQLIGSNNWSTDIRNRWQKPGDITDVPRISNNAEPDVNSVSSRFITKASFISLNNIRLGYTVPKSFMDNIKFVEQISIFVSGDNLWLASHRKGFNPSTAQNGASDTYRYSPLSTISGGIKVKF